MNAKPVILVVEDDAEMNDLECQLLAIYGMKSISAYSGVEALDLYASHDIDGVLLDVMLPEMDGFETCRRLRQKSDEKGTPLSIIIITAMVEADILEKTDAADADAMFSKPFSPDEVIEKLKSLLDPGQRESQQ